MTGAGEYASGTAVEIKAEANTGYAFSKWSDEDTNATRTITMNEDKSLQAVFVATGGGSIM